MINVPFEAPWLGKDAWITVPPQGYGGIQWTVTMLIDGLLELGHQLFLLGAPGSSSNHANLQVIDAGTAHDMTTWLNENPVDIVHDSSNGVVPANGSFTHLSTHHLTGRPRFADNTVYLSHAQRSQARATNDAPVIRISVNPDRLMFSSEKKDYLLFLGRISPWKGALEAAAFAQAAGLPLYMAGPSWEPDYLEEILRLYGDSVQLLGEVHGAERLKLLAEARAIMVLSQTVPGPWGDVWCEPGSTVVSEAAVSGTPVIGSANGCLAEIVPKVGCVLSSSEPLTKAYAKQVLDSLPQPSQVREAAIREWGHVKIAQEYESLYKEVMGGKKWS